MCIRDSEKIVALSKKNKINQHFAVKGVKMKKKLAILLVGTMVVSGMLTGCGGSSDKEKQTAEANGELKGDITFWHSFTQGPRLEVIQETADQFMKDNPEVNITIETFSWGDFYTKWTTGLASGNVPDMSTALPGHVVEMMDAEAVSYTHLDVYKRQPLYVEGCYFSLKELEEKIKKSYPAFSITAEAEIEITKTDSAGYVMEIQIGNQAFQGERIKEVLDLPSSCFSVQSSQGEVRFLCKGIGHGMGMSQYTAHNLALEGKNYEQILGYFFPDMEIEKEK